MKLTPARGYLFIVPVDDIPPASKEVGFGGKTDKIKLEVPYKLKVIAVGGPRPGDGGTMLESEVRVGDIISSVSTNAVMRERIEQAGFMLDDRQVLILDFMDVMEIWKEKWADLTGN